MRKCKIQIVIGFCIASVGDACVSACVFLHSNQNIHGLFNRLLLTFYFFPIQKYSTEFSFFLLRDVRHDGRDGRPDNGIRHNELSSMATKAGDLSNSVPGTGREQDVTAEAKGGLLKSQKKVKLDELVELHCDRSLTGPTKAVLLR